MPRANTSLYRAVSDQSTSLMLARSLVHLQDPNNLFNVITNGFELDVKPSFFPTGLPLRDRNPVEQRCTGVSKSCPAHLTVSSVNWRPRIIAPRKFERAVGAKFQIPSNMWKDLVPLKICISGLSTLPAKITKRRSRQTRRRNVHENVSRFPKLQQRFLHS